MIRTEIKKNICSVWLLVGIALMYALFMLGDSGSVLRDWTSTTVVAAIFEKFQGNWRDMCAETSSLHQIYCDWTANQYLSVFAPLFCSLPAMLRCWDEGETGNKRLILPRGTLMRYYAAKFIGGVISAALVLLIATAAYDATILAFYDWLPVTNEEFPDVYCLFARVRPESAADVSWPLFALGVIKDRAYFCLYAAMGSALCFFFTALFRSRYTVFGSIVLIGYVDERAIEELVLRWIKTGKDWMYVGMDIISPTFLQAAGKGGFYGDKEPLALCIAAAWILLFYGLAFYVMGRRTDVGER